MKMKKLEHIGFLMKKGLKTGEWKEYNENEQLESVGKYQSDMKTGEWKFYNEQGNLIKTEKY